MKRGFPERPRPSNGQDIRRGGGPQFYNRTLQVHNNNPNNNRYKDFRSRPTGLTSGVTPNRDNDRYTSLAGTVYNRLSVTSSNGNKPAVKPNTTAVDSNKRPRVDTPRATSNTPVGKNRGEFCSICQVWITIPFSIHQIGSDHIEKKKQKMAQNKLTQKENAEEAKKTAATKSATDNNKISNEIGMEVKMGNLKPEDIIIPEYDGNVNYGSDSFVPVTGNFCRICLMFYPTSQNEEHCKTKGHYDRYVDTLLEKRRLIKEENAKNAV